MIHPIPRLYWPNLMAIKTKEEEQNLINRFIANVFNQPCDQSYKNFPKAEYMPDLPISLCFLYDPQHRVKHIILLLNKKRGKQYTGGGQRVPKLAFDLMTGMYCVKKIQTQLEATLIDHLQHNPQENLVEVLGTRLIKGKPQYFEKAYDCDLQKWISNPRLNGYHNKLLMMRKLLIALQNFQLRIVKRTYGDETVEHYSFHNDLKPTNILVNEANEVVITDFGLSNVLNKIGYSPYYAHPMKLMMFDWTSQQRRDYHVKYGRKMDIWSLGIVFVVILTNKLADFGLPPLPFLDDLFNNKKARSLKKVVNQERITAEVNELKKRTENALHAPVMNALWDLVVSMLQLHPEDILSVEEAISRVDGIISKSVLALAGPLDAVKRCDVLKNELLEAKK